MKAAYIVVWWLAEISLVFRMVSLEWWTSILITPHCIIVSTPETERVREKMMMEQHNMTGSYSSHQLTTSLSLTNLFVDGKVFETHSTYNTVKILTIFTKILFAASPSPQFLDYKTKISDIKVLLKSFNPQEIFLQNSWCNNSLNGSFFCSLSVDWHISVIAPASNNSHRYWVFLFTIRSK